MFIFICLYEANFHLCNWKEAKKNCLFIWKWRRRKKSFFSVNEKCVKRLLLVICNDKKKRISLLAPPEFNINENESCCIYQRCTLADLSGLSKAPQNEKKKIKTKQSSEKKTIAQIPDVLYHWISRHSSEIFLPRCVCVRSEILLEA